MWYILNPWDMLWGTALKGINWRVIWKGSLLFFFISLSRRFCLWTKLTFSGRRSYSLADTWDFTFLVIKVCRRWLPYIFWYDEFPCESEYKHMMDVKPILLIFNKNKTNTISVLGISHLHCNYPNVEKLTLVKMKLKYILLTWDTPVLAQLLLLQSWHDLFKILYGMELFVCMSLYCFAGWCLDCIPAVHWVIRIPSGLMLSKYSHTVLCCYISFILGRSWSHIFQTHSQQLRSKRSCFYWGIEMENLQSRFSLEASVSFYQYLMN